MIIKFAVTNFRSIKDRQVMNFEIDGQIGKSWLSDQIITPIDKSHGRCLIKSSIIYGANASGKSNILKAIDALISMVENSTDFKLDRSIPNYEPFKLDRQYLKKPTIFEIDFIAKDSLRYLYEISFDSNKVLDEKLIYYELDKKSTSKSILFTRSENNDIHYGNSYRGKTDFFLNPNQLLLSKAGVDDIPVFKEAYRFFSTYIRYAPAQTTQFDERMLRATAKIFNNDEKDTTLREAIISIVKASDTGINRIFTQDDSSKIKFDDSVLDEEKEEILSHLKVRIKTKHPLYENGVEVGESIFDLSEESTGTMKLLGLSGLVVSALKDGAVVIVDELDKNLHPLLTRMIIGLFHNPIINKNNAQLIFSTHDVSLIDKELFRRDQITLINKDLEGKTEIVRLSDFKGISKITPLSKWYMAGMFKGIPAINEYQININ